MKCFHSLVLFFKLLQGPYDVVVLPGGNAGAQNLCEVRTVSRKCFSSCLCSVDFVVIKVFQEGGCEYHRNR